MEHILKLWKTALHEETSPSCAYLNLCCQKKILACKVNKLNIFWKITENDVIYEKEKDKKTLSSDIKILPTHKLAKTNMKYQFFFSFNRGSVCVMLLYTGENKIFQITQ